MPRTLHPSDPKYIAPSFDDVLDPTIDILATIRPVVARGNRPFQMDFDQQFKALIYFHLEEHTSERHLIQALSAAVTDGLTGKILKLMPLCLLGNNVCRRRMLNDFRSGACDPKSETSDLKRNSTRIALNRCLHLEPVLLHFGKQRGT